MKAYANGMKATEFSKKDIIELAKKQRVERWLYDLLMRYAEYYNYDSNKSMEHLEGFILRMLNEENSIEQTKKLGQIAEMEIKANGFKRSELNHNIIGEEPEATEEDAEKAIKKAYENCSINFTEEGCEFVFDTTKKRAKTYTYKVDSFIGLAKKLYVKVA